MSQIRNSESGVERYIAKAKAMMAEQAAYIAEMKSCKFDTIAVHGLYSVEHALNANHGSIIEPVFLSTSQGFNDSDELEAALAYQIPAWVYTRIHNPSIHFLESTLALLESYGCDCEATALATSSGMSAIMMATEPFLVRQKHDQKLNFVATAQCYGGTFQQFNVRRMEEQGIEVRWVTEPGKIDNWEALIDENTRFVYGEMPSNPGLSVFDLKKVADLAHEHSIPLIVDSTVATPVLMRPFQFGADIVVHSLSKSMTMSGFGIGGAVISKKNIVSNIENEDMTADFAAYNKMLPFRDYGPCMSPFNAAMVLAEIKTLRCKMQMVSRNSQKIAEFLEGHPKVERVNFLGLKSHPLHELATQYMTVVDSEDEAGGPEHLYGHLMSFDVKGGAQATRDVFDQFRRIYRATDLGRIKSVATIPAISTHQQQGDEGRELAGIPGNQIRLCVGGENPNDIIADLENALNSI